MFSALFLSQRTSLVLFGGVLLIGGAACWRRTAAPAPQPVARAAAVSTTGLAWDGQHSGFSFKAPFGRVVDASMSALSALGFKLNTTDSRRGTDSATLVAEGASKRALLIKLRAMASGETEVKVKVGVVGDRGGSERVLDEIRKAVGSP
jgi:hypothetical protein